MTKTPAWFVYAALTRARFDQAFRDRKRLSGRYHSFMAGTYREACHRNYDGSLADWELMIRAPLADELTGCAPLPAAERLK